MYLNFQTKILSKRGVRYCLKIVSNNLLANLHYTPLQRDYKPWYVAWSSCDKRASNTLKQYFTPPFFLPESAHLEVMEWIFMGTPGCGTAFHQDRCQHPTWQAQVTRQFWAP